MISVEMEKISPSVFICHVRGWSASEEFWCMLGSDRHHDSVFCDQELEKRHLDEALSKNAAVFDFGDLFCAMQGKYDPRADKRELRPELQGNNYLDDLVSYNSSFYKPYSKLFKLISRGNHETAISSRMQTDLTERFAERLNAQTGSNIMVGTYCGWVGFRFHFGGGSRCTKWLYYHHGYGGNPRASKGTTSAYQMAVYLPDAHMVYTGHTHTSFSVDEQRARITDQGQTYEDTQTHIKCPGYKNSYRPMVGWGTEKGHGPTPKGVAWVRFYCRVGDAKKHNLSFDVIKAK